MNYTLADAMALIDEFSWDEYNEAADFSDLSHIDLAYTDLTTEDGRYYEVHVYADLKNFRIVSEFSGDIERTDVEQYKSLADMFGTLKWMDFDSLIRDIYYLEEA